VGYSLEEGFTKLLENELSVSSRQDCADRCRADSSCFSFEYSNTEEYCNLNDEHMPTTTGQYKDYSFCRKLPGKTKHCFFADRSN
jgi:hypothetical protein